MAYFTINGYDSYSGCDIIVTASLPLKTKEGEDVYFTLGSLQTLSVSTHQDKRPVRSLGNINAKDYVMGQRTIAGSLVFAVFDRHFADKIMKSAGVLMADEIPALNLTINFANEYGRSSRMAIYGVKLLNEGQVMSINDLYTENTYQFVALGMEPLTADEEEGGNTQISNKNNRPTGGVITPNIPTLDIVESKEFQDSSGKAISDKIKNDVDYANKISIYLSASIEQPIQGEQTGIVTLKLNPKQPEGYIYITNLLTNVVEYSITVNNSETYILELPIGFYNAKYMNTTRTIESNVEKIVIKVSEKERVGTLSASLNQYPIIETVTENSIAVSMYNKNFDSIVCYTSGDKDYIANNGNTVVFYDLKSDTEYNIYAVNNYSESNIVTVKTFPDSMSYYNKFIDYLYYNRKMLQNDYHTMVYTMESLLENQEWTYNSIIDGINTLSDDLIKQELLLYAMCFENSMIQAYNYKNPYKLNIVRNNIFDTNIFVDNWESTKYYSLNNNKNKLEGIIKADTTFDVYPSKAYCLYGIDKNNSSIRHYISTFSSEGKEFLSKYKDTGKYNQLDLTYNRDLYPQLTTEELYALTIRDNFLCDKYMLDEPYIYIKDDKVYADVAYDDKVILDETYYLCMAEMYETLDTVPKRKEVFNRQTKSLDLSGEYMPLDPTKIYHFWVENHQGAIISKPYIFNYKDSIGLNKVLDKELLENLRTKKRLLSDKISSQVLDDIIYSLYSESVPKKDLDTRFELALLDYGARSFFVSSVLKDYLYEVVLSNISNKLSINRLNSIQIFKRFNQFKVETQYSLETKLIVKSYDLVNQEVDCDIYGTNSLVNIKGDYMTIYLVNDYIDKVLGFIVIDCSKYNYKALGFDVEMSDK